MIVPIHKKVQRASWSAGQVQLPADSTAPDYVSFESLFGVLWRQWKAVTLSLAAGLSVAAVLYTFQPKIYRARATVEIQLPNDEYLNQRQLDPNLGPGANMLLPYLQTQLRLLQSDAMIVRVAEQLNLPGSPEFAPKMPWWRKYIGAGKLPARPAPPARGPFIQALRDRLDARMLGDAQIFEISFEAEDPKLAAQFVNTIVAEYRMLATNRNLEAVNQTRDLLGSQIAEARRSLDTAEKHLQEYVSTSGLLSGGDKDSVAEQRLKQLQGALTSAQDARITDQAHYEAALGAGRQGAPDALESESLRAYRMRITELRQQWADASEILQPAHYKVRELRAQLAEVEQAYQREREAILHRLESQYQASRAREQALVFGYDEQVGRTAKQMTNAVRYSSLKRDVETQQQLYDSLVQKTKEAGVLAAMRASNVKLVDAADTPYRPVRPQKTLYAALGLAAGVLPALLIAFSRERRARRWPVPDSRFPFGLATLGVIPHFEPSSTTECPELASWTSPESPFSSVMKDASHVLFADEVWPRVVGVTSPHNGAGKTTVACNLAIGLARSGRSVLLVDADHQTPRLHEIFGIDNQTGFSDILSAWVTRIPNLVVLVSGQSGTPTLEDYTKVLQRLRADFQAVIFDLPSVLTGDFAPRFAAALDSVVLVISPEYTTPQSADLAIRRLAVSRTLIAGALFNGVRSVFVPRLLAEPYQS